jgi:hypothetical protein
MTVGNEEQHEKFMDTNHCRASIVCDGL